MTKKSVWASKKLKLHPDYLLYCNPFDGFEVGVFETIEGMREWFKERQLDVGLIESEGIACTVKVHSPEGIMVPLMWIPREIRNTVVCHECLHAAWWVLEYHGVKIDVANHETLTYMMMYLARQIYDRQAELKVTEKRKKKNESKRSRPKAKAKRRLLKNNHKP